jgi:hypothetical protein
LPCHGSRCFLVGYTARHSLRPPASGVNTPQTPGGGFPGEPRHGRSRPAFARSPGVTLKFIGARAESRSPCLLFVMLLIRYKQPTEASPSLPAPLPFGLPSASCTALLRPSSLASSDGPSSLLSEAGEPDLKESGLLNSELCSATQNLAYLPCRIGSYDSTFRCFVGGGVAKKTSPPPDPQDSVFLTS